MTCTKEQIRLLVKYRQKGSLETAAAKAGMSLRTARRYLKAGGVRQVVNRSWRTRLDPFSEVWGEVKSLLEKDDGLEAKTLMEWLMGKYPDRFSLGQIRTLRRRVKEWRVLEGPEKKEVFFRQNIQPGKQSQSDYTWCNSLNITIDEKPFPHLLYHFMLPYSRWEFVYVCFSESFETLITGYQRAVTVLKAVAPEHRTDNLAAAVPIGGKDAFQRRWQEFLAHYGVSPSKNNPYCSNENGSVEKSHDLFKRALDQRLRLRGSRNFGSTDEYEAYLKEMTQERNRSRRERCAEELRLLQPLPADEWHEPREYIVTVSAWSTIVISGAIYSLPSRFIGQRLKVKTYPDQVRIYYGKYVIQEMPRLIAGGRAINYRHLIFHLLRKPGAFRNYQFREELFPRVIFRQAYDVLRQSNDLLADKEYLKILDQAAIGNENEVALALQIVLDEKKVPSEELVKQLCQANKAKTVSVDVFIPQLNVYDSLLNFG